MRKYARVQNNIVVEILSLEDFEIQKVQKNSLLIDIEDEYPEPKVNWKLDGNKLAEAEDNLPIEEKEKAQQEAQSKKGLKILPVVINKLGTRNLKLTREGISANVAAMVGEMAIMKLLLETGALKTASYLTAQMAIKYTHHADILQETIDDINSFLQENGWQ
jgi:hypothetical protein